MKVKYTCPKCGGHEGYPTPTGMSILCPRCPWQQVLTELYPEEEMSAETAKSVCFKLIVLLTRKLEAQGVLATFPYLREQCMNQAEETIPYFHNCFEQALKDELIFNVNGLYSTKRPGGLRSLDDDWHS